MMRTRLGATFLLAALMLAGCPAGGPAKLTTDWPERAPAYDDALATWTRKDRAYSGVDLALAIEATFLAPEWRAAYVAEQIKRAHLTEAEASALRAKQEQETADVWQFLVAAETHEYSANDLSRKSRSMWTMTLIGPSGRTVAPSDVRADTRSRAELQGWFPNLGPFQKAYLITFPRVVDGQPVLEEGQPVRLRIGSTLGTVQLTWN